MDLVQLRITKKRKQVWDNWLLQSNHEIASRVLWEAVELALKYKEIEKKAKHMLLVDPGLVPSGGRA